MNEWNEALEAAASIAEASIKKMEEFHASWRVSFGDDCAQPYHSEILTLREVAADIRALSRPPVNEEREVKRGTHE